MTFAHAAGPGAVALAARDAEERSAAADTPDACRPV